MRLYHFTAPGHLRHIFQDELIRTTESNIGSPHPDLLPYGERYGPDVVWTFNEPEPNLGHPDMLNGELWMEANKQLVRITVEVPGLIAFPWEPWANELGMNPEWRDVLKSRNPSAAWYVVTQPIPKSKWIQVDFRESMDSPWREVTGVTLDAPPT